MILKGGERMRERKIKNKRLKIAIMENETTQKSLAKEMGVCTKTFVRKCNGIKVNGYTARFSDVEKSWLADRLGIDASEIE